VITFTRPTAPDRQSTNPLNFAILRENSASREKNPEKKEITH